MKSTPAIWLDRCLRAPLVALGRIGRAAPALMPLLYAAVTVWVLLTGYS